MDKAGAAAAAGEVSVTSAAGHPADHPQHRHHRDRRAGSPVLYRSRGGQESTGHLAHGPYAEYASGLAAMDWLVIALKATGAAALLLLSIASRPRLVAPAVVTVLAWAGPATLWVNFPGSVAQVVGMASGLTGTASQIDLAAGGYVPVFRAADRRRAPALALASLRAAQHGSTGARSR